MEELIPTFVDISDWEILVYQNTLGSRSKNISINPTDKNQYFFKGFAETPTGDIKYPMEFWSEIVASKVGTILGFNLLDYNIAFHKDRKHKIGSLSKSMINDKENKLTEGITYLTGYNPRYNPNIQEHKHLYTFQFICEALTQFNLATFIDNILEIIIFDAIIGNSDRHQENWGIITNYNIKIDEIIIEPKPEYTFIIRALKRVIRKFKSTSNINSTDLFYQSGILPNEFAPIYDSGCCLGRELTDEKIIQILNNKESLERYISKGESEIHWTNEPKKKKHFELIELVKKENETFVKSKIQDIQRRVDFKSIKYIIDNIDNNLPMELNMYKLGDHRKELMFKLITLRLELLFKII